LSFTVSDAEDAADQLAVSAVSSNTAGDANTHSENAASPHPPLTFPSSIIQ
jgi:hypothetical protein